MKNQIVIFRAGSYLNNYICCGFDFNLKILYSYQVKHAIFSRATFTGTKIINNINTYIINNKVRSLQ